MSGFNTPARGATSSTGAPPAPTRTPASATRTFLLPSEFRERQITDIAIDPSIPGDVRDLTVDAVNAELKEDDDKTYQAYKAKVSEKGPIYKVFWMLKMHERPKGTVKRGQGRYHRKHIRTGVTHPCQREDLFLVGEGGKKKKRGASASASALTEGQQGGASASASASASADSEFERPFNMTASQYDDYLAVWKALWDPLDEGRTSRQSELKQKFLDANPPELINHTQCRTFLNKKQQKRNAAAAVLGGGGGSGGGSGGSGGQGDGDGGGGDSDVPQRPARPRQMEQYIKDLEVERTNLVSDIERAFTKIQTLAMKVNVYKARCRELAPDVDVSDDEVVPTLPGDTA